MLLSKIFLGLGCIGLAGTCVAHGLTPFHHSLDLLMPALAVIAAVACGTRLEKRFDTLYAYFKQV
jgi:uncharacterized membrane protein